MSLDPDRNLDLEVATLRGLATRARSAANRARRLRAVQLYLSQVAGLIRRLPRLVPTVVGRSKASGVWTVFGLDGAGEVVPVIAIVARPPANVAVGAVAAIPVTVIERALVDVALLRRLESVGDVCVSWGM